MSGEYGTQKPFDRHSHFLLRPPVATPRAQSWDSKAEALKSLVKSAICSSANRNSLARSYVSPRSRDQPHVRSAKKTRKCSPTNSSTDAPSCSCRRLTSSHGGASCALLAPRLGSRYARIRPVRPSRHGSAVRSKAPWKKPSGPRESFLEMWKASTTAAGAVRKRWSAPPLSACMVSPLTRSNICTPGFRVKI